MARSKGPVRASFCLRGIVMRSPCRRRDCRIVRLLYALSPATRRGRRFGLPPLGRVTAPLGSKGSKAVAACRCPGVHPSVMSLPPPAARRWTLVLTPPWLRPSASASAPLFLPQRHAGGRVRSSHRQNGGSSRGGLPHRPAAGRRQKAGPRCRPGASGKNGSRPSARRHSALANHAKAPRCGGATGGHEACDGDLQPDGQSAVLGGATVVAVAPIAGQLIHVYGYSSHSVL